jgi:dipeptidyl aminopeptidase/acylaminoacyl peptidase
VTWLVAFAVLAGLVVGYGARLVTAPAVTRVVTPAPTPTPMAPALQSDAQYGLTIPAQRAKRYPGGQIKMEEDLGDHGAYRLSRVSYPSDGYRIYALVATPNGPRPVFGFPVVILAHGYVVPDTYRTDGPEYMSYIQALANHGYVVIKPDLRGHGQSWGVARGAYYSADYNADVLNLAASLRSYGPANAQAVGLFGHSMGGHIVLDVLAVQPGRFKAAVIASGVVGDINDMFYNWKPASEATTQGPVIERQRVVKVFGAPKDNPVFWRAVSPLSYAGSITTPVQIHHGLADAVVPPLFSQQLTAALTAGGHPPEYYAYAGTGHMYAGTAQADLLARTLQLFDRTLAH